MCVSINHSSCQTVCWYPLSHISVCPLPVSVCPFKDHFLWSAFMETNLLGYMCDWEHAIFFSVWLISTWPNVFQFHPCFSKQDFIPFCDLLSFLTNPTSLKTIVTQYISTIIALAWYKYTTFPFSSARWYTSGDSICGLLWMLWRQGSRNEIAGISLACSFYFPWICTQGID